MKKMIQLQVNLSTTISKYCLTTCRFLNKRDLWRTHTNSVLKLGTTFRKYAHMRFCKWKPSLWWMKILTCGSLTLGILNTVNARINSLPLKTRMVARYHRIFPPTRQPKKTYYCKNWESTKPVFKTVAATWGKKTKWQIRCLTSWTVTMLKWRMTSESTPTLELRVMTRS